MIILDTNVVSEAMRTSPAPMVMQWFSRQDSKDLFITAITQAEILFGLAIMPGSTRRIAMEETARRLFADLFAHRILPFDSGAAIAYAGIVAKRRRAGRPIATMDAQIAAIAQVSSAELATRNVADFEQCGIIVLNPWQSH